MDYIVRKATLEDVENVSILFGQYRVFYEKKPDHGSEIDFISERIKNKDSVIFIAEDEHKKPAGFVQLYPLFSSTRMKKMWLLNDLFVDPDFRGMGVSKLLIDSAKQLCRETGACEVMLETAKSNHIGNQLYPATGFSLDTDHHFYSWNP